MSLYVLKINLFKRLLYKHSVIYIGIHVSTYKTLPLLHVHLLRAFTPILEVVSVYTTTNSLRTEYEMLKVVSLTSILVASYITQKYHELVPLSFH
jgi:hypothetical protein